MTGRSPVASAKNFVSTEFAASENPHFPDDVVDVEPGQLRPGFPGERPQTPDHLASAHAEAALWDRLATLDDASRAALLAHCVSFAVNALYQKADQSQTAVIRRCVANRIVIGESGSS
jgi:hypothetical protein